MSNLLQKAQAFAAAHFLYISDNKYTWHEAYDQIVEAVEQEKPLPCGLLVWEPFENRDLGNVLDLINDMADQMCRHFAPDEKSSEPKRLLIIEQDDRHVATIANFDHQDLEIVHIKYESDFPEPQDMIDIPQPNGVMTKAYGHIHCIDMESDNSLNVNAVFDAVKLHHS